MLFAFYCLLLSSCLQSDHQSVCVFVRVRKSYKCTSVREFISTEVALETSKVAGLRRLLASHSLEHAAVESELQLPFVRQKLFFSHTITTVFKKFTSLESNSALTINFFFDMWIKQKQKQFDRTQDEFSKQRSQSKHGDASGCGNICCR